MQSANPISANQTISDTVMTSKIAVGEKESRRINGEMSKIVLSAYYFVHAFYVTPHAYTAAKPITSGALSIRLHESRLFNNRMNISNLRNTQFKEKLVTAHYVEELDPLRFQSPRTSSRSRDREVALTVPHVHSNRTLFLAKKPQVS
ncbi:hypothetical protein G5I_02232 [Acromyrmex echinatior]|uniref:Uncharacterized protein n=1 Tax=Acromyrmex echinatior TaxID=103372 RepID=F4W9S5_ACREC|nr:hypothetical protein G5I_02232 [Acromyrmex echinatior]